MKRGEVYWVGKLGYIKMGVVVSSNKENETRDYLNMCLMSENRGYRGVQTEVSGRTAYVMPTTLKSYHQEDVRTYVGTLTEEELAAVDKHLEEILGFDHEDEKKQIQIDNLRFEVLRLQKELQYASEKLKNRDAEIEQQKKLYEKAVDKIAEMTLAADVAKRVAELRAPVVEEEPELEFAEESEPEVEEPEPDPESEIIEEPEPEKPSRITFPVWEPTLEKPKEKKPVKKVNVNTASVSELIAVGFSKPAAGKINAHVKRYGPYKRVEDLKEIDEISGKDFRKLRDFLEV